MVQRYKPTPYTYYEYDREYPEVKMEHSRIGEWVTLETYLCETNRLNKQIERLKKRLSEK